MASLALHLALGESLSLPSDTGITGRPPGPLGVRIDSGEPISRLRACKTSALFTEPST